MSTSTEFVELSEQKAGRMQEKASVFSQTCSRLSQYLKENGGIGDLSLGMTCNTEGNGNGMPEMLRQTATTMNLFPMTDRSSDFSSRNMSTARNLKSMDLFPQQAGFASTAPKEEVQKRHDSSVSKSATPEPQTAPMTIFYGGQVLVFNDFPSDKAKEVMRLASNSGSKNRTVFPPILAKSHPAFAPGMAKPVESISSVPPSPNATPNFGNSLVPERVQVQPPPRQPIASDLPIARRASLHRFLEKRKDRITGKAPYQTDGPVAASSKAAEVKSWLGLASQSPQ